MNAYHDSDNANAAIEQAARECAEQAAAWRVKWPHHCKACDGWGGSSFTQSHGPGPGEQMFDVCEALPNMMTCHRCGKDGLSDTDGEGPCSHCGWDYDDGAPSFAW